MSNLSAGSLQRGLILDMPLRKKYMKSATVLTDRTPYGNDGAVTGAVVGELGTKFDGTDDNVNCGDIGIAENGTATVMGWFYFKQFAIEKGTNNYIFMADDSNAKRLLFQHAVNNRLYVSEQDWFVNSLSKLSLNTWHHIAITYSGDASTAILYIDTVPETITVQAEIDTMYAIDDFSISTSVSLQAFDGTIDSVRIYNRALSAIEIEQSYRDGKWEHP